MISLDVPRANGPMLELMSPLDDVILDFMMEQDIPGASVAVSRDGNMLYCQGKLVFCERGKIQIF